MIQLCTTNQCYGVLAVYRVTFAMAVFHFFHALIVIGMKTQGDVRMHLQNGFWPIKLLLLFGGIVGSFWIPNDFFEVFGYIALVGAGLFILAQMLMIVDFAHSWAENWILKYENQQDIEGCKTWWWALLSTTGFFLYFKYCCLYFNVHFLCSRSRLSIKRCIYYNEHCVLHCSFHNFLFAKSSRIQSKKWYFAKFNYHRILHIFGLVFNDV